MKNGIREMDLHNLGVKFLVGEMSANKKVVDVFPSRCYRQA